MGRAWHALAAYTAIAVVATWPLARGLGRDVAWDLGDSLFSMWVLAWDAEQLLGALSGELSRVETLFNGNIFYPAPLTLAYSEHLLPQALQILPIYAISRNPILCYNLLFLSTFVLSGLGTYLLVRELTGRPLAAFAAGLFFAFAPYRLPQSPHVQVLSSQWMPFVLYGFRRYFASVESGRGRLRPLGGAALALVAQNLSCGYYLLYFSPFAAAYALWEVASRRLWRDWRMWTALAISAAGVLAATVPFLLPYVAVNEQFGFTRARGEIVRYSADVYSFATASGEQLWGGVIRAYPKPEGDLFFGFVPIVLATIGVFSRIGNSTAGSRQLGVPSRRRRWLARLLAAGAVLHLAAAVIALAHRRVTVDLWLFELQISNINQMLLRAAIFAALLLAVSPAARERGRVFARERGFFVVTLIATMWLALGPLPQALGRPVEIASPYALLYEYVPGFEGLRAPARFAMISVLMLAVLGGFGATALTHWRRGSIVVGVVCVLFLVESISLPFAVNGVTPTPGYNLPEARVYRPGRAPNVYKEVARLAPDVVLAELPLGQTDFDLRAIFYSIVHWRPLLNGYSGFFPPHYGRLAMALSDVPRFPDAALQALRAHGATHVIVHEGFYLADRGAGTSAALRERGAVELYRDGSSVLLRLP